MELEFTSDQDDLRASVRAVLVGECPIALVREVVEKGTTADELWRRMVELDWPGLTIAEAHGGLGLGFVELAVVLEEMGRVIAPGPFFPTLTQFAPVVRACGSDEQQTRWLGAVARGELTGSVVFDGAVHCSLPALCPKLRDRPGGTGRSGGATPGAGDHPSAPDRGAGRPSPGRVEAGQGRRRAPDHPGLRRQTRCRLAQPVVLRVGNEGGKALADSPQLRRLTTLPVANVRRPAG